MNLDLTINALNNFGITDILYIVIGLIIGAVVTFILTKKAYEKQIRENPPITEKQIRQMFISMGQKPSEARIQQVLRSMGLNNDGTPINKNNKK